MSPVVVLDDVTIRYAASPRPALRSASVVVEEGELALLVGRTGSGKSTLLGAISGRVPHFTGGHLSGRVTVAGLDTRTHRPRDLAGIVGVVAQDPLAGFVTDTVEEELAYTLEQLAVDPPTMRRRVEEVLDLMGIAELRDAPLRDLSGGEQQRVAIGAVLTAGPRLLVLDEPTSALDPVGAQDVLATVTRLVHDLGLTVVMSEHRLERVAGLADTVLAVADDGTVRQGEPRSVFADLALAPPVVELGRVAGWEPLPLTVREARRAATGLRDELATSVALRPETATPPTDLADGTHQDDSPTAGLTATASTHATSRALRGTGVTVRHGEVDAVRGIDLGLAGGEVVALMGRNGSGKSSLLWALHGSGPRTGGEVLVTTPDGSHTDPADAAPRTRRRLVGLVPQSAPDLLYLDTVDAECAQSDHESAATTGTTRALLDRLAPGIPGAQHPRDLSEGQQLALVLAIQLATTPPVLLLDEPTRGLDHPGKDALATLLADLAADGHAVALATHDVEFAATVADRVVVLSRGHVVTDGAAREVLTESPEFAPQVAAVLAPVPLLTVPEVVAALGSREPAGEAR
jgi:energy-coupling factor transport system ATP-binding protein